MTQATSRSKLQLPPGVSVKRQGNAYVIFRNGYEEIGDVVVCGTPLGDTQLQPYVEEVTAAIHFSDFLG
ncbi:hypothetical protein [Photorhabdus stackebrandtii]|uniref:Uncharacterized protein n=1 Tax=Photorhabdus stackebrandtii TaxID=1123042 RepID=A0A7X5QNA5_9GAMM|nr:hypothetical protein [Photorhabdus stackebrandtii]NHB97485.1 hypothetical protein [Photorhabdus stackebrandtii]